MPYLHECALRKDKVYEVFLRAKATFHLWVLLNDGVKKSPHIGDGRIVILHRFCHRIDFVEDITQLISDLIIC